MLYKLMVFLSVPAFIFLSDFSCKKAKLTGDEKDFPADSITKWKNNREAINTINHQFAAQNPHYFTDSVRKKEKPRGIYRIAVIGDSFIWGDGVLYKNTWSHKLEEKVAQKYRNVEVMSWGQCGWSTLTEYDFFKSEGYQYHPDLLIFALGENDPELRKPRPEGLTDVEYQNSLYEENNLKEYGNLLKEMASIPEIYQTKILFVLTPLCNYKDNREHKNKIIKLLHAAGIPYLDLYPAYSRYFGKTPCVKLFADPINGHPGEKMNEMFATEVMKYLESRFLKKTQRELSITAGNQTEKKNTP